MLICLACSIAVAREQGGGHGGADRETSDREVAQETGAIEVSNEDTEALLELMQQTNQVLGFKKTGEILQDENR